jgi:hypothetical protein
MGVIVWFIVWLQLRFMSDLKKLIILMDYMDKEKLYLGLVLNDKKALVRENK